MYVDEMPRDCASCKHYHMNCADGYSCSKLNGREVHCNFSEGIGYRHKDCPLQSLTDYTNQVRKEVCEEIRVKAEDCYGEDCYEGYIPTAWVISEENLKQIEGECDGKTKKSNEE